MAEYARVGASANKQGGEAVDKQLKGPTPRPADSAEALEKAERKRRMWEMFVRGNRGIDMGRTWPEDKRT